MQVGNNGRRDKETRND